MFSKWFVGVATAMTISLLAWNIKATHEQEAIIYELSGQLRTSNAKLDGSINLLTYQINTLKELSMDRNETAYTVAEAIARQALVDERCESINLRLNAIESKLELLNE